MFCPVAANEENLYSYPGELIGAARHYGGGGGGTVTLAPQFVGPVGQLADYDEPKVKHDWFSQSTSRTVTTGDSTKEGRRISKLRIYNSDVPDPHSFRSVDPDPYSDCGSGSRDIK